VSRVLLFGLLVAARATIAQPSAARDESVTLPLAPTRIVKFTTDEGTWMSVDVSPDGKTIVFDLVGDLYTLPITGGKATRITSGMPFDVTPRFSPDGKTIVFVSDRGGGPNLWLIDRDGRNPRPLTRERNTRFLSPAWLPDGSAIVASSASDLMNPSGARAELFQYPVGGGTPVHLAPDSSRKPAMIVGAAPTADARSIYVSASWGSTFIEGPWQIARLDRATRALKAETPVFAWAFRPAVSANGKYLTYVAKRDTLDALMVRDIATGNERVLVPRVQANQSWALFEARDMMPGYAFTPDSRAVVLSSDGKLWRIDIASGEKTAIPFAAEVEQGLAPLSKFAYTEDDSTLTVRRIRWPRISPDGKRLLFSAMERVWVMNLPKGVPRRLTKDSVVEDYPVWSPDGKWIAWVTWNEQAGGEVYRVRADGIGAPENLTQHPAFYARLNYGPDGKLVALRGPWQWQVERGDWANESIGIELVWFEGGGGEAHVVAPVTFGTLEAGYRIPHFAGDPGRVYMYSEDGELVSMKIDGSDRRTMLKAVSYEGRGISIAEWPYEILLSPDSRYALVLDHNGVSLLSLPSSGIVGKQLSLTHPDTSAIPVRSISRVATDFIGWNVDGKSFYYSAAHSLFIYDLAAADSVQRAGRAYAPRRVDVTITVPRDRPHGTIVLKGARLITMKGSEVIANGTIVVKDNRIVAVGPSSSLESRVSSLTSKARGVGLEARVMDVSGKTILPGYVDLHAHMPASRGIQEPQPYNLLAHLAFGVTTARDPQTSFGESFTYEDMVAAGEMIGPRFLSTGRMVSSVEESPDYTDVREVISRYGPEFWNTKTIKQYESGDRLIRQWIVMAARELKLSPTNEGNMFKGLTMVLDGYAGVEHFHAFPYPLFRDYVQVIAQSGTTWTPTLATYGASLFWRAYPIRDDPKIKRFMPLHVIVRKVGSPAFYGDWTTNKDAHRLIARQARNAAKVVAAGGRVGMGAHGDLAGLGSHFEIWGLALGGMPNLDVLRCATLYGADAVGLGGELGSLEVGKLADLQVLDKNPIADLHNTNTVRYVMKNGRLYDANTLDELWPRPKKLPTMWWWERDSAMEVPPQALGEQQTRDP
jgi:Tol biopolymer transport system component